MCRKLVVAVLLLLVVGVAAQSAEAAKRKGTVYFVRASSNQVYSLGAIWSAPAAGGKAQRVSPRRLGAKFEDPEVSPDGKLLTFSQTKGGVDSLWTMRTDGRAAEMIEQAGTDVSTPSFSPDGTKIVFSANGDLSVIDTDGTDLTALTSDGTQQYEREPTFFPSGQTLAFSVNSDIVHLLDLPTGTTSELPGGQASAVGNFPDVSPDGSQIVGNCGPGCIINTDGTGLRKLDVGYVPEFSPDGKWVVGGDSSINLQRAVGGKVSVLVHEPKNVEFYFGSPTWGRGRP